jgi:hypothetical protein
VFILVQQIIPNFTVLIVFRMITLNVSISDLEYNKFGIKNRQLAFSDFVDIVSRELARQNLEKCVQLAEKHGLSSMTLDEINDEIKAARKDAKSRH